MNNARFGGQISRPQHHLGLVHRLLVFARDAASAPPVNPDKVISSAAYTQGWMWRVGQAHPMGYSEWRFGYWAADPPPLDTFIGKQRKDPQYGRSSE